MIRKKGTTHHVSVGAAWWEQSNSANYTPKSPFNKTLQGITGNFSLGWKEEKGRQEHAVQLSINTELQGKEF